VDQGGTSVEKQEKGNKREQMCINMRWSVHFNESRAFSHWSLFYFLIKF